MKLTVKLKKCPVCDSKELHVWREIDQQDDNINTGEYYWKCADCGRKFKMAFKVTETNE